MHRETWLDRLLREMAAHLGIVIHGNLNQQQLNEKLAQFNIHSLLKHGPQVSSFLSYPAQQVIEKSFKDVSNIRDVHLHNLGEDEGNYLNPRLSTRGKAQGKDYFKFLVIRQAAGIRAHHGSTEAARQRLHAYVRHFPKLEGMILPVHPARDRDGEINWEQTGSFLTDGSALTTAQQFDSSPSKLFPAVSLHPWDPQWRQKLAQAAEKGIRLLKWLPPQGIEPDAEDLADFYQALAHQKFVLLAHSGPEHTVPGCQEWQDWGNPLRFRQALAWGITVILAHCGYQDLIPDLDDPQKRRVPGHTLFKRLAEEAYEKKWSLYGDLAAVIGHYGPDFVKILLEYAQQPDVRILYGSDYPFTNLVQPRKDAYRLFARQGLLEPDLVKPLQEIRQWNPLLANYVFARSLAFKTAEGKTLKFPLATFTGEFAGVSLKLVDEEKWQNFRFLGRIGGAPS